MSFFEMISDDLEITSACSGDSGKFFNVKMTPLQKDPKQFFGGAFFGSLFFQTDRIQTDRIQTECIHMLTYMHTHV